MEAEAKVGQAAFLLATMVFQEFWKCGGAAEQYLKEHPVPEEHLDALRDLTTLMSDTVAAAADRMMESPGLLEEYAAVNTRGDWDDEDLLLFTAHATAAGIA